MLSFSPIKSFPNMADWSPFAPPWVPSCLAPMFFAQSCYKLAWVFCMHHFLGSHGFLPTSCTLQHQNHKLLHFQYLEDSLIAFGNMFYNFGWLVMLAMDCFQKLVTSCLIFWNKHTNECCINFIVLQPITWSPISNF